MEVSVPTYSYACTECDDRFDVVQAFTDDALTTCERCSGRLRKLFSPVGVVFKGSGFYHNDSRAGAKAATNGHAKAETPSSSEAGPKTNSADKSGSADKASANQGDKGSKAATAAATSS